MNVLKSWKLSKKNFSLPCGRCSFKIFFKMCIYVAVCVRTHGFQPKITNELSPDDDIIKDIIKKFVTHTGQKFAENFIQEIENAMKENIEV